MNISTAQKILDTTPHLREYVRRQAGKLGDNCPIVVVSGTAAPRPAGESFFYTTPAGDLIRRPAAYSKKAYDAVYNPSTRRIEVGVAWLGVKRPVTFGRRAAGVEG